MTPARCVVEVDEPMPHVRLAGVLDGRAAEEVRATLLTLLADRTDAVVVDMCDLTIDGPAALSILSAGIDEAAQWAPGQLRVRGFPADWERSSPTHPVAKNPATLTWLDLHEPPAVIGVDLEPVVDAAGEARHLVADGCARWNLPELVGPASITITEMVNNVVAHARTPMTVRLARGHGALHAGVRDHCLDHPTFRGAVPVGATGGRGLLVINALARRWGATELDDGKLVWAILHRDDAPTD